VRFEKGLDAGAGADKAEEPLHFIGHELKIERLAHRDKLLKKSADVVRPDAPVGTAAGDGAEGLTAARPSRAQFVEAGLGDAELSGRRGGIEGAGIELAENAADKLGREAVEKLLFFIPSSCASAEQKAPSACFHPFRFCTGPDSKFRRSDGKKNQMDAAEMLRCRCVILRRRSAWRLSRKSSPDSKSRAGRAIS
jgi:hypothetical protein